MKVQVYIVSYEDAKVCVDAGVDFIGVVADNMGKTPSSVSYEEVKKIFSVIPDSKMKVALTIEKEYTLIEEIVSATQPDILHIGFEPEKIQISILEHIRKNFPYLKILQAIPMNSENSIDSAMKYQHYVDLLILDINDPDRIDLGATGLTHDWNKSAKLVEKVNIPVILAGGLSPDNVIEAIRIVKPWGVDSFSKTNTKDTNRKDRIKVENFVKYAKSAF